MPSLRSSSRSKTDQDLTLLSQRRPSWTPSLSEYQGTRLVKSHSRRRARQEDSRFQDWSASFPQSRNAYHSLPSLDEAVRRARRPRVVDIEFSPEQLKASGSGPALPESPEDGKRFRSWEINVKDLVGDAVGNMSMSPTSRDIALAARRGLFIFDLESLDTVPRFLPQGGTWDVADVQWNPHLSHAQYIVSTSSEKLLIWNLRLGGKTSIQHILKAHYRAITDINWHTTECDVVCSIGIDSWIWAWDIRTARKPIFGVSPFKAGGTQVKWNYKDGNLLASSHADEVLIWDRRKGSLPIARIQAHSSKIYGIDWSRSRRDEIVTCSLDKTIKIWDTNSPGTEPKGCIRTTYPVWRARNLPFGEGILSLPQRGETTLEMYAKNETQSLVETFEGHTDVVKEFVWRRGPQQDFQLITWSKDRTLRFWPIDATAMERVGYQPELKRGRAKFPRYETENIDTFSHPPEVEQKDRSAFSAPFLNRTILAEIRAPLPPKPVPLLHHPLQGLGQPTPPTSDGENADLTPTFTASTSINLAAGVGASSRSIGGKMSKAGLGFGSVARVDQLAWLASVKEVSSKRGSSSGGGSYDGADSVSRLSSTSRPSSGPERSQSALGSRQRSGSFSRLAEERPKETDNNNQSLQDEITTVLTRLAASKIKLEKYDLSKKRTCTLGLHSPLGEKRSVYMRVTFTFPRDYPQAAHPNGTPTIEVERNPLISLWRRDCILKHLRRILERKRPCLEACLRFLLFADDGQVNDDIDSETSSDEDQSSGKKTKEITISLMRNSKNLTEPRTSQGVFGPNGELICFFRDAPRIVRHNIRGLSQEDKPNVASEQPQEVDAPSQTQKTRYFQSPALVADAVRRLSLAATDRSVQVVDPRHHEMGMSIVRAVTNLLTLPQPKAQQADLKMNPPFTPSRRTVFLLSTTDLAGADKTVAEDYIFTADSLREVCEKNADAAKARGRFDHERAFRTLRTLFRAPQKDKNKWRPQQLSSDELARDVILKFYSEAAKEKDLQMLAIISMLVLQTEHGIVLPKSVNVTKESNSAPLTSPPASDVDYFSLKKPTAPASPVSFAWTSPKAPPHLPSVSSSNSSRGSWSSLFNTGTVRQFMSGVQDTLKEGLLTPSEVPLPVTTPEIQITTVASPNRNILATDSNSSQQRKKWRKKNPIGILSNSWSTTSSSNRSRKTTLPTPSAGDKRLTLRFVGSGPLVHEKRVVFDPPINESPRPLFDAKQIEQFRMNVYQFAELLLRWKMYYKRLELLKAVTKQDTLPSSRVEPHRIGFHRVCTWAGCRNLLPAKASTCQYCFTPCSVPLCTVCRLPAKGLARTCVSCLHITHVTCWNALEVTVPICPAGCGCFCSPTEGQFTRPSTRLGFTPPTSSMLLTSEV